MLEVDDMALFTGINSADRNPVQHEASFHTNQDLKAIRRALDSVCKEWTDRFGFEPIYDIADVTHFAFIFMFTIFVDSPRKIYQFRSSFIDDNLDKVFLKKK